MSKLIIAIRMKNKWINERMNKEMTNNEKKLIHNEKSCKIHQKKKNDCRSSE